MSTEKEIMPQALVDEMHGAFNDMKSTLDSNTLTQSEVKERVEKCEKALQKSDEANQKLMEFMAKSEDDKKDLESKFIELQKQYARATKGSEEAQVKKEALKIFEKSVKHKFEELSVEDQQLYKKYLRTDSNPDGGFLVIPQYIDQILKNIVEISPVRQVANIVPTTKKAIQIPRRTQEPDCAFAGEGASSQNTQSKYGLETIHTHRLTCRVRISCEMLNESEFDMEAQILADVAENFGKVEGNAFINGTGVTSPEGILTNTDIQEIDTAASGLLDSDTLIKVTGELKQGYNPMFMFNRRTFAAIRQLKDDEGRYQWIPTFAPGAPSTINGEPYILAIDLPDVAAGAVPILYGDFRRGYTIADGRAFTVLRDDFTEARECIVVFNFNRWVGGQVVLPEAIKKVRILP